MAPGIRILYLDDEKACRASVAKGLDEYGIDVTGVENADQMRDLMRETRFDLVLLDREGIGEPSLETCGNLRAGSGIGIIVLTGKMTSESEMVDMLRKGADDYIIKPVSPPMLEARIRAVLRRPAATEAGSGEDGQMLAFAGWRLDRALRKLHDPVGVEVFLTGGEFDLLAALADRPQQVLSRERLLDIVGRSERRPFERSIDTLIGRLRKKLEADPRNASLIKTVRSAGYFFSVPVERL